MQSGSPEDCHFLPRGRNTNCNENLRPGALEKLENKNLVPHFQAHFITHHELEKIL